MFSGRTIDVPACFIAGKSDWGVYRTQVRSRECKAPHVPNGAVLVWLIVRDIGYNRSSRRKSVDCCGNSFADEVRECQRVRCCPGRHNERRHFALEQLRQMTLN